MIYSRVIYISFRRAYAIPLDTINHHYNLMDSFYNFRFLSWVQEIYCDFYAAKIIADSKRKSLIDSINYKMKDKDGTIQGISHPSWNNRLKYATNYNFDEKEYIE